MARELTETESGGTVRTPGGDPIGTVTRIEEGIGYVEPDPDAPDTVTATLGWDDADAEAPADGSDGEREEGGEYPLPRTALGSVEEGEIHLRRGAAEADREDEEDAHDRDASLAREEEAQQEVEDSVEREAAARESSNPDAHRDEEPFSS